MSNTNNTAANDASDNKVRGAFSFTMSLVRLSVLGDLYDVVASLRNGKSVSFQVIQHRHGDWYIQEGSFSKCPESVYNALRGYAERGHLDTLRAAA